MQVRTLPLTATLGLSLALSVSAEETCRAYPFDDAPPEMRLILNAAAPALDRFPYYRASLATERPTMCLEDGPLGARGFLDVDGNRIVISTRLALDEQVVIFLHELRHLQQIGEGFCPASTLSMAENARAVFALEADAMAVTTLVAWTLAEAGLSGAWQALTGWPLYGDIPVAFQQAIDRGADETGASAAAFYQWYGSDWRRESYYIAACSDYLDRQDEANALPQYQLLPPEFLSNLCRLPDGTAYPCAEPEDLGRR
ncbi:DUF6782 family putative metallopeptidase [Nioella aestuarii]|uniref:DUF6782 family putative metallopeptidase n=1 Tax=Nioella aestuarii TaxID=1662864 RepID=UPI003D7F21EB